jgi:hypothetical protein
MLSSKTGGEEGAGLALAALLLLLVVRPLNESKEEAGVGRRRGRRREATEDAGVDLPGLDLAAAPAAGRGAPPAMGAALPCAHTSKSPCAHAA